MWLANGTARRVGSFGAVAGVVLATVLASCIVALAAAGQAWADNGDDGAGDLAASDSVVEKPSVRDALGAFDIPEGAVSGTWGSDEYAAQWYLADEGGTLVVGPGTICTSGRDGGALTPDFNGMRSSIKTVRFTQEAFIYPTAANLFEGFSSLVSVEGFSYLSGKYGVLNAHRMFAGCAPLKAISVSDVKFSSYMEHPYTGGGMGVSDIMLSCRDAFEGCTALETLDLGPGWESGYVGPPVFGPEDKVFDGRATFPVKMTDGTRVYVAGEPIPDGEGHYSRVEHASPDVSPPTWSRMRMVLGGRSSAKAAG